MKDNDYKYSKTYLDQAKDRSRGFFNDCLPFVLVLSAIIYFIFALLEFLNLFQGSFVNVFGMFTIMFYNLRYFLLALLFFMSIALFIAVIKYFLEYIKVELTGILLKR